MLTMILQILGLQILFYNHLVYSNGADDNGTESIDIQLTFVRVPAIETYYVCQQFKIDANQTYHVTRFEPILNNTKLIHHMLLFGCDFELDEKGPHPCDSLDYRCRTWLVKWDKGMTGDIIMPEDGGVRVGKGSFQYIMLQIHWNNKDSLDNETGSQAALDILRDREVTTRLAFEENYDHTKPIWHRLDPPEKIYPGEPIEVKCWYDSSSGNKYRNFTTYFGQGSSAEMCYAFIRYYPRIVGFDQCVLNGTKTLNC